MRKLLIAAALLFALGIAPSAFAQTFGTCWGTDENAASSTTITVSVSPTGGSGHILVGLGRFGATGDTVTLSDDSGSNTWSPANSSWASTTISSAPAGEAAVGYVQNPAGGTYTVTATVGAAHAYRSIFVCEYSGLASSSSFDSYAICNSTAGTSTCTSGSLNTTGAGLVAYLVTKNTTSYSFIAGAIGSNTGTVRTSNDNDAGLEDTIFTSAQSGITATINTSGGTLAFLGYAMAFKASGGSSSPAAPAAVY